MPLLTSAPISDKEQFLQHMQANTNIQTTFEQGLEGITHFSSLAKPTMARHDLVRAEIEPGIKMVSEELVTLAPITRNICEKPIASKVDLENLIHHTWADRRYLVTSCGKLQFIAVNVLAALTSQRPGVLIESTNYRGSNEAIHWRDVNFDILPNPDAPLEPCVAVAVRFRNSKGHRNQPQYFYTGYVVMEPLGSRAYCLVALLLYLAFDDNIFEDVHLPKDSRQSVANLPVFRANVVENGVYIISPTDALWASTHGERLRSLSRQMGYILHLTMNSWRRGAVGKSAEMLPDCDRQALMNHAPSSTMYQNAYQSHLSTHDLGGIWHGRGQDSNATELARSANSLSIGMDPTAPIQLGVHDRAQLLNEPELIAMREHTKRNLWLYSAIITESVKNPWTLEVEQLHLRRKSIDAETPEGKEEFTEVQGLLRVATKRLQAHVSQYNAVIQRESRVHVKLAQDKHMAGNSRRQLGLAPANPPEPHLATARPPLAAKTGQGPPMTQLALRLQAHLDVLNPEADLCDTLYHSSYDNVTEEALAVLNGYLGLLEHQFTLCYPGESPTKEERCPVCNQDCRRGIKYVGEHIHCCLSEAQENTARDYLEENFTPLLCQWTLCKSKDKLFSSRKAFVKHAETHKNWMTSLSARNPDRRCQWLDGGELYLEDEHGMESWERHFTQVHGTNLHEHVQVNYYTVCGEWDVNEVGDSLVWEDHQMCHFTELFSRFSQHHQGEVDLTPVGVEFMAAVDNAVEYENGSGFDGALPEFHGEVVNRVCLAPMYCPGAFSMNLYRLSNAPTGINFYVPIYSKVMSKDMCGSSRVASVHRLKLPPPDLSNTTATATAGFCLKCNTPHDNIGRTEHKLHQCVQCRRQFTHIRKHFDNPGDCVVKSFRIDDPKSGERCSSKTPLSNVREWLENEEKDKWLTAQEDDRGKGPSKRAHHLSQSTHHINSNLRLTTFPAPTSVPVDIERTFLHSSGMKLNAEGDIIEVDSGSDHSGDNESAKDQVEDDVE
ncbi:hypothetical protein GGX14DRAFT_572725 [Mycena pura]|uniref:Uncharacterized protein n=1 Tax=Mycena pura TaxID=153505 RepID=A0AAD6V0F9_9AGAR|nr:hypothetical protein GGX14DRAFT_572725 [Mycena pura]